MIKINPKLTTSLFFAVFAVFVTATSAYALSCPAKPGGSGETYEINRPLLKVAINDNNENLYITDDNGTGSIWEASLGIATNIDYNNYPYDIEVDENTDYVYYAYRNGHAVKVYNPGSGSAVTAISVGTNPYSMGMATSTKRIYVANYQSNNVSVISIDPASPFYHRVIKTISVGNGPWQVDINDNTGYAYVANRTARSISIISESTLKTVGLIPLSFNPGEIAVNEYNNRLYILSTTTDNIAVYDISSLSGTLVTTITAGSAPWGIDVNPNTNHVFISDNTDGTVTILDGTSLATLTTVNFDSPLRGIDVNLLTDEFAVASEDGMLFNDLPPCDRRYVDRCIEWRNQGLVTDADVETLLTCYFTQM